MLPDGEVTSEADYPPRAESWKARPRPYRQADQGAQQQPSRSTAMLLSHEGSGPGRIHLAMKWKTESTVTIRRPNSTGRYCLAITLPSKHDLGLLRRGRSPR